MVTSSLARFLVFITLAVVLVLLPPGGVPPSAYADGEYQLSVREASVDQAGIAQLLVKVVDRGGKPVVGLSAANFSLKAGERTIPVTGVQTATDAQVGISTLLVIDTSGSMLGTPLAAARQAADQYTRTLRPADEVAVVSFANGSQVIADFSNDFAAVQAQLSRLTAFGDTALFSAVGDSASRIAARPASRRVVIFLSDGADFGISTISRDQAISAAAATGISYYTIGLGPTIDAAFLQHLAEATGGGYYAAPSADRLASIFSEISELLRSEYAVTVDFSGTGLVGNTASNLTATGPGGNGTVQLSLNLPRLPGGAAPSTLPAPVTVTPAEGASSAPVIFLILAIIAGVIGWFVWRRLKRRPARPIVFTAEVPSFGLEEEAGQTAARETPPATLQLPNGDEFVVQGLATVGVDRECDVMLPLTRTEFGNGDLRLWFANDRYVIRDLAPRPRIRVNGRPVPFSVLGDGDEIDIRGLKLRFFTQQPLGV